MSQFLDSAGTVFEHRFSHETRKIVESIKDSSLNPFTDTQKFLIQLLCESYEEKLSSKNFEMDELYCKLQVAEESNSFLQDQLALLRETNKTLNSKLKEANNMVRILSKYLEAQQTPKDCLSPSTIEQLVDSKTNTLKVFPLADPSEFTLKRKRIRSSEDNKSLEY